MSVSANAFAVSDAGTLKKILHRPLIVGASVSGDYLTNSPGKRLALRYTDPTEIKVVARKGKTGKEVLNYVSLSTVKDRTAIIGIDLFFWDSFVASPRESLKAIDRIVALAAERKIPLVIGEIPELMPQMQKSVSALNQKIIEVCKSNQQCYVLPLNKILYQAINDGYVMVGGKKHLIEELLPDGLHIAAPASEFLADRIAEVL